MSGEPEKLAEGTLISHLLELRDRLLRALVAVVLLVLMGIVRIEKLREHRGYVLIGIFILAALLTPPDAISQCSLAIPMYLLYEGGIVMARLLSRSKGAQAAAKAGDT